MKQQYLFLTLTAIFLAGIIGCQATAGDTQPVLSQTSSCTTTAPQSIRQILDNPGQFLGKQVKITVFYGDPHKEIAGVPERRNDWPVYDDSAAIYVSGSLPPGLSHYTRQDWGTPLEVTGLVSKTSGGLLFIKVEIGDVRKK